MYQSLEIEGGQRFLPNEDRETDGWLNGKGKAVLIIFSALFVFGCVAHVSESVGTQSVSLESFAQKKTKSYQRMKFPLEANEEKFGNDVPLAEGDYEIPVVRCGQVLTGLVPKHRQAYFRLTTPSSGTVTIDTCDPKSQLQDTWLYVYPGTTTDNINAHWNADDRGNCQETGWQLVETFKIVAMNPNPDGKRPELKRSTLYTLGVGAYSEEAGKFTMRIRCTRGPSLMSVTTTKRPQTTTSTSTTTTSTTSEPPPETTSTTTTSTTTTEHPTDAPTERPTRRTTVEPTARPTGTPTTTTTERPTDSPTTTTGRPTKKPTTTTTMTGEPTYRPTEATTTTTPTTSTSTSTNSPQTVATSSNGCPTLRVRKPWATLTAEERRTYLDAVLALRQNGRMAVFRSQHAAAPFAHNTEQFLPWHRYLLWEFEEQVRQLPDPKYRCFALPFWDWTHAADRSWNVSDLPMWSQGLDEFVDCENGYRTPDNKCLTRDFELGNPYRPAGTTLTQIVEENWSYTEFRSRVEGVHDTAHVSIGGNMGDVDTASLDPVFWMLHTFVDFLWELRQDCHNIVHERDFPNPNKHMDFRVLSGISWSHVNKKQVSAREVFNSQNAMLRTKYNASFILTRARAQRVTMGECNWRNIIRPPVEPDTIWETVSLDEDMKRARAFCEKLPTMCKYNGPLEICGEKEKTRLDLTLADVLNKDGVRGDPCVINLRQKVYPWSKKLGTLRGLCNGFSDNVCWQ